MSQSNPNQEEVLALLQPERWSVPGQVASTASRANAIMEALVYLVKNTPEWETP